MPFFTARPSLDGRAVALGRTARARHVMCESAFTALQHWGHYIPLFLGDMAVTELDSTGDNVCFAFVFHFNRILPLS